MPVPSRCTEPQHVEVSGNGLMTAGVNYALITSITVAAAVVLIVGMAITFWGVRKIRVNYLTKKDSYSRVKS